MLNFRFEGRPIWFLSVVSNQKWYPYTMLNRPSHVIYFIIWRLTSLQNGCRLVLRTPFLSSENCSSGKKNSFLAFWTNFLSSLSQGTPIGRSVTLLMSCGVSLRVNPLKLTTANVFDFSFRDLRNSSVISSSWPWSLSQNHIQCARENKSTTSGVSHNFLESEGSFLMNPRSMVKTLCFIALLSRQGVLGVFPSQSVKKRDIFVSITLCWLACSYTEGGLRDFSTQSAELRLHYTHSHIKFTIFTGALTVSQFFYRRDFNSIMEEISHADHKDNFRKR